MVVGSALDQDAIATAVRDIYGRRTAAGRLTTDRGDRRASRRRHAADNEAWSNGVVLDWAASGAMALTGQPDGAPVPSPAPVLAMLGIVTDELAQVTQGTGTRVRADPAELLTARAALAGFTRRGRISAGGSSYLLPAADGWWAITLSRPDDLTAVHAILGMLGLSAPEPTDEPRFVEPRAALTAAGRVRSATELAAAAQLLGVPAAALPTTAPPAAAPPEAALAATAPAETALAATAGWPPWRATRIAPPSAEARLAGAVVADLSSMWAGPLCARLLGLARAYVIKVESPGRPDGARAGNREFFAWLHAGHRSLVADFGTEPGRAALKALGAADIVIEASRPRALAALGLAPDMIPHPDGQVWLSITGYGRAAPDRVAFGDDAAVAGGLVGWASGGPAPEPVFCADAIADPLAGVCGALAVARSVAAGGGELIELSMRDVAAAFAAAPAPAHGRHEVRPDGFVTCPRAGRRQAVLPPRRPVPPPGPMARHAPDLGADTSAVLAWLDAC
jgi:crotonobetainyl-CoA:carnitine CoA-transferase CaiB-like acyl-CoA transferase